jgi:hypothetical protein
LARGRGEAERLCRSFAATTLFKFTSAIPAAQTWSCRAVDGGITCGFEGEAVCSVEERELVERETCGPQPSITRD